MVTGTFKTDELGYPSIVRFENGNSIEQARGLYVVWLKGGQAVAQYESVESAFRHAATGKEPR